jgi:Omp85 superfamily domain
VEVTTTSGSRIAPPSERARCGAVSRVRSPPFNGGARRQRAAAARARGEVPLSAKKSREAAAKREDVPDYDTPRIEPAGFPLIGGDSDIGFEFGAVATLTKFGNGVSPYLWNLDVLVAASVKSGPEGAEVAQQAYLVQLDAPKFNGGRVRVNPQIAFERTINMGYFGIGNASNAVRPPLPQAQAGRYFEYDDREARLRELTRIEIGEPWQLMVATTLRYDAPNAYPNSRLTEDVAAGRVRGLRDAGLGVLGVGALYDSRDNEYFPRRGSFHQMGVRGVFGIPGDAYARYGALGVIAATYVPVGDPFVFAARGLIDAQFGNVPFYDLRSGGPFWSYGLLGSGRGVRGVPIGRYAGPLKVVGNLEMRSLFATTHIFGQLFRFGANVFLDAGRLWSDYTFSAPEDGTGLGIKWGAGGGGYMVWGQAAIFRMEVAYSPDAVAENPTLPVGIYVEDGVMF